MYIFKKIKQAIITSLLLTSVITTAAFSDETVTKKNYILAESNTQMALYVKSFDSFGKFHHNREMYDVNNQITIRANMDTIYSFAVFDLNSPVEVTMPDTKGKYQSLMAVSQNHSITSYYEGKHTFTKEGIGTRYVFLVMRTFVDPSDKASLDVAHKLQDAVVIKQADKGEFSVPSYDEKSLKAVRASINEEANKLPTTRGFFGHIDDLTPQNHLYGAAYGWAGLPEKDAIYEGVTVEKNDGKTAFSLTVKDVPVDGFWSITIYNSEGYMKKNEYNSYSINNITAKKNENGSFTINFGGDPKQDNFLYIFEGWSYVIRLYQPHKEVLDGTWEFPKLEEKDN